MKPIWIVDDDQSIRFVLERALTHAQLPVRCFAGASELLQALDREQPQVLVSDIRMPGLSGVDLLAQVKARLPGLPVIIMTAHSDLDSAVAAFQGGAFEYLPKPFDLPAAVELIRRAVDESLREELGPDTSAEVPEMLGQAPAMQEIFRAIGRLSQSRVTVLITGESGSGKELVARALHRHGPRGGQGSAGPFVAINTAAIPRDLLESELFGHERGAFTGAQAMHRGRFEQAEGGTLFLDEIGDMPPELQTRLLRVLGDGQYYRVGGHQARQANVRIIAATHQDLEQRVREGSFREDLYHRLNVIRLRLPPLRERREDIPTLTRHFLAASAREHGVEAKRISHAALQRLQAFDFPGNVRQLENICRWLTVMAPAQVIAPEDLPRELQPAAVVGPPLRVPTVPATLATAVAVAATAAPAGSAGSATANTAAANAVPALGRALGTALGTALEPAVEPAGPPGAGADTAQAPGASWQPLLEREVRRRLEAGEPAVWEALEQQFEGCLLRVALELTQGHRHEAARRLGIGRNTLTRKVGAPKAAR